MMKLIAYKCPQVANHTPRPEGYLAWDSWADKMSKTHKQIRCPGCGLFAIWVAKKSAATAIGNRRA